MRRTVLPERGANSSGTAEASAAASRSWAGAIGQTLQSGGRLMAQTMVIGARAGAHALAQQICVDAVDLEANMPPAAGNPAAAGRPAQSAGDRLAAALDNMSFRTDIPKQHEMAAQYREWARQTADAREAAGADSYSLRAGDAALPAGYDFARQVLSSMARSPATNSVATALAPRSGVNAAGQTVNVGELNNDYDPLLAGGVVGGLTAHLADTTLLSAMDRRAALANFPQFKAIDPLVLVPDPCPVQLRVVNNQKEFWRPVVEGALGGPADQPTMNELKALAAARRKSVETLQKILDGKHVGVFAQPLMTAVFNVLRRQVMPLHAFSNPALVFAHALWASGLGGGMTKLTLGMGKSVAYTNLDDLLGGTHKANVFAKSLPRPEMPAAALSDIAGLPGYGLDVAKETLALTEHFWAGPWRTSRSLLPNGDEVYARLGDVGRAIASNVMASVGSRGIGSVVAQLGRHGSNSPLKGESQRSPGYQLQQSGQSSSNDWIWQAGKSVLDNMSYNLGSSLDKWRENKLVRFSNSAYLAQKEAAAMAADLQGAYPAHAGDHAMFLSTALNELAELEEAGEFNKAKLEQAKALLAEGELGAGSHRDDISQIRWMVDQALRTIQHREELTHWVKPKSD